MKTSTTDMEINIGNLNYLQFKYGLQTMNRSRMLRIGILGRKPKPTHKISLPKNFRLPWNKRTRDKYTLKSDSRKTLQIS